MAWISGDLLPHSICLAADPLLIWLHATSDAITAISYYSIPSALFIFLAKRRDIRFRWIFILSGAFIVTCGTTHLLGAITLWQPMYWIEGIVKAITAVISTITAVAVWPLLPKAIALPSAPQLNQEIAERIRAEAQLRELAASLEARVEERTAELLAEKERVVQHAAEIRLTESRLAESENRFRAAQEASLDAFIIFEPIKENGKTVDLRVLYANQNAARYCHSTAEAMQGRPISEIIPSSAAPGGLIENHGKVADNGTPLDYILEYDADGIRGYFQNVVVSFEGLIAATFRDVTALSEAQKGLVLAKVAAENANAAKSRFLAAASHDLRQPLQALGLYLEILRQKLPADDVSVMRYIDICVANLTGLLSNLLDLSKLDAGVIEPKPAVFPVCQALDTMLANFTEVAREKGLRLRMVPSRLHIRTDPVMFERIIGNLVSNAIRYTQEGGIVLGCRHRAGRVWLEVTDTGIGIPPDKLDAIFEDFYQLNNAERSREKGSGLGLAIVRREAQLLGLEIRVSSIPNRGSTFALELPLVAS